MKDILFVIFYIAVFFDKCHSVSPELCHTQNGTCSRHCPEETCPVGSCCNGPQCYSKTKCCLSSQLIYSNGTDVLLLDVDSGEYTSIVSVDAPTFILGMDYHKTDGYVYYFTYLPGANISMISRIPFPNPLNKDKEVLLTTGIGISLHMLVDSKNNHLYWTDELLREIGRCNLDGSNKVAILKTQYVPRALELDVENRHLYFTQWNGTGFGIIERCDFDGDNRITLVSNKQAVRPNGVTLDLENGRFYWTDASLDHVKSAKLDGSDVQLIRQENSSIYHPFDIVVDCKNIYYTDWYNPMTGKLWKMSKVPGSEHFAIGPPSLTYHFAVHLYRPTFINNDKLPKEQTKKCI